MDLDLSLNARTAPVHDFLKNVRVLIAEDNEINLKVITRMMSGMGAKVSAAVNGRLAIEALEASDFDLILMDCMVTAHRTTTSSLTMAQMPVMGGLEAAQFIRTKMPPHKQPIIVALTADAFAENSKLCREAGMEYVLHKPINQKQLQDVLGRLLKIADSGV